MTRHKQYDHYVDVSGLHCPQPVISCKATLVGMAEGEILKLVASDHSSLSEIPRLVESMGDELIGVRKIAGCYQYTIRRNSTTRKGRRAPVKFLELTGLAALARLMSTGKALEAC
ncbi:MAG: sulfurtransferase TusA family protein [Thiogranum sp.]